MKSTTVLVNVLICQIPQFAMYFSDMQLKIRMEIVWRHTDANSIGCRLVVVRREKKVMVAHHRTYVVYTVHCVALRTPTAAA